MSDDLNPFPVPLSRHKDEPKRVVLCLPIYGKIFDQTLEAIGASAPLLKEAGWEVNSRFSYNNPYISNARDELLREALDLKASCVVFIDQDVSWKPRDLLTLIETKGDVVAGTYRFKTDDEDYMGMMLPDMHGQPQWRKDGKPFNPADYTGDPLSPDFDLACVAFCIPAGFLKVTAMGVSKFIRGYPHLCYGAAYSPCVDLFNHGAHEGVWYGEDYAFSRNWRALGEEILLLPNLDITHWDKDGKPYPGNYHRYMAKRPGGRLSEGEEHDESETDRRSIRRSAA